MHTIRKSPYGRTQLYVPSESALLREARCLGGAVRYGTSNVYHHLPDPRRSSAPVCCWHCCEPIADSTTAIPLPRVYDPGEDVYHVYGRTCSPSCAKAYVLEHTTFDRGQHLNTLVRMLRDVYGVRGPVVETPPRPALKRFGGTFDPRNVTSAASCRLVEPPFVSYCMIVEEHARASGREAVVVEDADMEDDGALEEPEPPALFENFLVERRGNPAKAPASRRASPPSRAPRAGPMSKFCK